MVPWCIELAEEQKWCVRVCPRINISIEPALSSLPNLLGRREVWPRTAAVSLWRTQFPV